MIVIHYGLQSANEQGFKGHPATVMEALGCKVYGYIGEPIGDCVFMQIDKMPDSRFDFISENTTYTGFKEDKQGNDYLPIPIDNSLLDEAIRSMTSFAHNNIDTCQMSFHMSHSPVQIETEPHNKWIEGNRSYTLTVYEAMPDIYWINRLKNNGGGL